MSIRVILDQELCQGHGLCQMLAPDAFRLDAETGLAVLIEDVHADTRKEYLVAAVKACPVGAIEIKIE